MLSSFVAIIYLSIYGRSGPTLALDGAGLWGTGAGGGPGTGPGTTLENGSLPGTISNQAGSSIQIPFNFGKF